MTRPNTLLIRFGLPLLVCALAAPPACAEHAAIDLFVIGPDGQQQAASDQEPPAGGVNPRPRLTVKAGDPLVLQFILTNVYPHGLLKQVKVRYFVVRSGEFKGKTVPELSAENVVIEGTATVDLKPKARVGTRQKFRVEEPGIYLVRVDTLNTKSDHEHFSAIDLEVK